MQAALVCLPPDYPEVAMEFVSASTPGQGERDYMMSFDVTRSHLQLRRPNLPLWQQFAALET